jgi:hypothetical protein
MSLEILLRWTTLLTQRISRNQLAIITFYVPTTAIPAEQLLCCSTLTTCNFILTFLLTYTNTMKFLLSQLCLYYDRVYARPTVSHNYSPILNYAIYPQQTCGTNTSDENIRKGVTHKIHNSILHTLSSCPYFVKR